MQGGPAFLVRPASNAQSPGKLKKGQKHLQPIDSKGVAEGEGFEPPVPLRAQRFSRPPVSTAHTSLRMSRLLFHCMTTPLRA
jgi:hypothetical protein